jgi:hypothetical protein
MAADRDAYVQNIRARAEAIQDHRPHHTFVRIKRVHMLRWDWSVHSALGLKHGPSAGDSGWALTRWGAGRAAGCAAGERLIDLAIGGQRSGDCVLAIAVLNEPTEGDR